MGRGVVHFGPRKSCPRPSSDGVSLSLFQHPRATDGRRGGCLDASRRRAVLPFRATYFETKLSQSSAETTILCYTSIGLRVCMRWQRYITILLWRIEVVVVLLYMTRSTAKLKSSSLHVNLCLLWQCTKNTHLLMSRSRQRSPFYHNPANRHSEKSCLYHIIPLFMKNIELRKKGDIELCSLYHPYPETQILQRMNSVLPQSYIFQSFG